MLAAVTPHGLAAACGSAPNVGVAGFLLGGGLGPLASTVGFSSDLVRSFDVVTPMDGAITVSQDTHGELFWGLRGGKGGFGVVTSVTIDLLDLAEIVGGGLYFAGAYASAVLHAYAAWASDLPASTTTSVAVLRLPDAPVLPAQIRGQHVVHVRFATVDSPQAAATQLVDLRDVARPLLDTIDSLPYAKLGSIHGDPTAPMPVANGTASLASLEGGTVDALLAAAGPDVDIPISSIEIRTLGLATREGAAGPDAVGGRGTPHMLNAYAAVDAALSDEQRLTAARHALDSTRPWQAPVTLVNFVGRANDASAVLGSWNAVQNERLNEVRDRHDPDRLFPYAGHVAKP